METLIAKLGEQSLSVGIMLVMFYYQREDKKSLVQMACDNMKIIQNMQVAIDRLTEKLDSIQRRNER